MTAKAHDAPEQHVAWPWPVPALLDERCHLKSLAVVITVCTMP
jgi:hypothetical protein